MKNEFSIIHLHNVNEDFYMTTKRLKDFFEIAHSYYYNLRENINKVPLDDLALDLSEHRQIEEPEFNVLCNAVDREEAIAMIANLNFENKFISIWYRDAPVWKTYTLTQIDSAIEKTTVGKNYTVETQKELFTAYLEGNQIVVPKLGNGEKYWGKGEFIKSCFKELLSDGKAHNYSEIAGYISKKAERMNIQDEIKATSFSVLINRLIQRKNSQYMRVARGYYKMKPVETMPKENSSTQDKLVISKTDFIRNCFKELLDDGQRHSFNEILECINKKSEMTSFEEYFDSAIVLNGLKMVLKKDDAEYAKVDYAVYQKVTPGIKETNLNAVLDKAYELQNQIRDLCEKSSNLFPQISENIKISFKAIDEGFDGCIELLNCSIENAENEVAEDESSVQTFEMKM